jgi:hypothetical protein
MSSFRIRLGVGLALVVNVVAGGLASADDGPQSHVDSMSASALSSAIAVTGQATFVDVPVLVGESFNTPLVPGIGADVTNATISRPATGTKINFKLDIADQPAQTGGVPELIAYQWDMQIKKPGEPDGTTLEFWAARSAQGRAPGGTAPVFYVDECVLNPDTGINECSGNRVTGRMEAGVVEWQVTPSQLGSALAGDIITAGGEGITVVPTAAGVFWGLVAIDRGSHDIDYTVPAKSVKLGIAPAGTPEGAVALQENATVATNSSFSGLIPRPSQPGDYIVVAEACYGAESCSRASTTITI